MFKVIDNFLEDKDFQVIKNTLLFNKGFDWYFNNGIIKNNQQGNLHFFQFTHFLYKGAVRISKLEPEDKIKEIKGLDTINVGTKFFNICNPILKKLGVKYLVRIKINLNVFSPQLVEGGFHRDYENDCKAAVFYVNTNNGYTKFKKNNKIINSVENRMLMFKANELHTGTNTTDQKCRIVINFSYF